MNQRKPRPCSMLPLRRPPLPHAVSLPFCAGSSWAPAPSPSIASIACGGSRLTWPATAPAKHASRLSNHRISDLDTTRHHAIMCTVNTERLPSPPSRPTLSGMLTVPPLAVRSTMPWEERSLGSLAAVAGRVASGLRREAFGFMLARLRPCPKLPAASGARLVLPASARKAFGSRRFLPLASRTCTEGRRPVMHYTPTWI